MNEGLRKRLEDELSSPGLTQRLVELCGSDFRSLMLEVFAQRAEGRPAHAILEAYRKDRFVQPSKVSMKVRLQLEQIALETTDSEVEILELSPLAPLGSCSAITQTSQDRIVSADRHLELCADPTNFLALECALRRRSRPGEICRLATSARTVRAQPLTHPDHTAHFRLWAMVTGGRNTRQFQVESVVEQLRFLVTYLGRLAETGFALGRPIVYLADWSGRLGEEIVNRLQELECDIVAEPERERARGYYRDLSFRIDCPIHGKLMDVADGGFTNWTAQLCADKKESLLIGGLGLELLAIAAM